MTERSTLLPLFGQNVQSLAVLRDLGTTRMLESAERDHEGVSQQSGTTRVLESAERDHEGVSQQSGTTKVLESAERDHEDVRVSRAGPRGC